MADAESVLTALTTLRGMQFVEGGVEALDAAMSLIRSQAAEIERLRAELAALRNEGRWEPGWRHINRGTEYQIIGSAMLQASTGRPGDGATLVLYKGEDGKIWARAIGEFHDGRFVPLPAPPQDEGANHG